jgi:hypothetical protein
VSAISPLPRSFMTPSDIGCVVIFVLTARRWNTGEDNTVKVIGSGCGSVKYPNQPQI